MRGRVPAPFTKTSLSGRRFPDTTSTRGEKNEALAPRACSCGRTQRALRGRAIRPPMSFMAGGAADQFCSRRRVISGSLCERGFICRGKTVPGTNPLSVASTLGKSPLSIVAAGYRQSGPGFGFFGRTSHQTGRTPHRPYTEPPYMDPFLICFAAGAQGTIRCALWRGPVPISWAWGGVGGGDA